MTASRSSELAALENYLKGHPHITFVTPSSPDFASLRAVFNLDSTANPLAIVRPQSANDVALLVKYAKYQGIKFVVRTGGHNLFGLSSFEGALTIDMRDIAYVHTDRQNSTARVGGGILIGDLAEELAKEGLATPSGTFGSVGYAGWSTYGGYGLYSAHYGLGVDQILAATIVDAGGAILEADEKLLTGIRGAGGKFGVIVELTIKVYPLKTILAGEVLFDSTDLGTTMQQFNAGYQALSANGLPPTLGSSQMVVNTPHGRLFGLYFVWSSENEAIGREWLRKIEALGTVVMNTVGLTTLSAWLKKNSALLPTGIYGEVRTQNIRKMTNEVTDIIAKNINNKMTSDPGNMLTIHELRGTALKSDKRSVFGTRDAHFMLEIIGGAVMKENREQALSWSVTVWEDLQEIDPRNLLTSSYISLDPEAGSLGQKLLSKFFGAHDQEVLDLKETYDPEDVFCLAVPRLKNYA